MAEQGGSDRRSILGAVLRVLLTNDDGIEAEGLQALRRALVEVEDVELAVIAPDSNRSATARSITIRRPIWVQEVDFGDGGVGLEALDEPERGEPDAVDGRAVGRVADRPVAEVDLLDPCLLYTSDAADD